MHALTGLASRGGGERKDCWRGERRDLLVILVNERGSAVLKVLRLKVRGLILSPGLPNVRQISREHSRHTSDTARRVLLNEEEDVV